MSSRYYKAPHGGHRTMDVHLFQTKALLPFCVLFRGNQKVGDSRRKALDKLRPTEVTTVLSLVALIYRKTQHNANSNDSSVLTDI